MKDKLLNFHTTFQVKQGCEPPTFTCHFLGWNPDLWAQDRSYETYRKQITSGVTSVASELTKYDEGRKLKYADLKGKGNCPTGVDPTKKEVMIPYTGTLYLDNHALSRISIVTSLGVGN